MKNDISGDASTTRDNDNETRDNIDEFRELIMSTKLTLLTFDAVNTKSHSRALGQIGERWRNGNNPHRYGKPWINSDWHHSSRERGQSDNVLNLRADSELLSSRFLIRSECRRQA